MICVDQGNEDQICSLGCLTSTGAPILIRSRVSIKRCDVFAMSSEYLDLACSGKNEWWRYLAGISLIIGLWVAAGIGLYGFLGFLAEMARQSSYPAVRETLSAVARDRFVEYIVLNLGHVAILVALTIAVRFIHKRRFLSLITPRQQLNWNRIGWGFAVYFGLSTLMTVLDCALDPSGYSMTRHPVRVLVHAPVVLVLTPIQTTTEELLFRGYLLQATGLMSRRFWFPAVITSLLFLVLHLANPEVQHGMAAASLYYFGIAFLLAAITMKSNSLELAIGAHAAINLFAALLVNYSDSVLEIESVFFSNEVNLEANLVALALMALFSYLLFFRYGIGASQEAPAHEEDKRSPGI